MGLLISQVVNGLVIGILYGLAALGFTMIYKSLGYLNFAHSDSIMLGAVTYYVLISSAKIPVIYAFLIAILTLAIYGVLVEKILYLRFRRASGITFMLVTMSWSTIVKNVALIYFGPLPRGLDISYTDKFFVVGGNQISYNNFVVLVIALAALFILQTFFYKTKFGLAIRMAQENADIAALMGVNVKSTRAATFAIASVLGCIAGLLLGPLYGIYTEMGIPASFKSFVAAVIGGLGNFPGALVGGLLVGQVESLSSAYIGSGYKDLIVYIVGIIVLGFFPQGILRRAKTKH